MRFARHHRSTREAFADERFPAVFGPYRAPGRLARVIGNLFTLALLAGVGVLLAWRG